MRLLLRSSWLTVDGGRRGGAAKVLIAGADRQSRPDRAAWLVAFPSSSRTEVGVDFCSHESHLAAAYARVASRSTSLGCRLKRQWRSVLATMSSAVT